MQIKLKNLKLRNFKGIKEFTLDLSGNVNIYGDNATGKTTLYDAFLWLLFDKDSNNKKDFSIKTTDDVGNVIHFLEHEVEGTLEVDGKASVFKKMLSEKWVKKRGEEQQEFSGHETSYWIDEVPKKKTEYTAEINRIIDENIFKLITNPLFFNTQLKWEERRNTLMLICGDVTLEEVATVRPNLKPLIDILGNKDIEDYRKIVAEKIKKLNKQIEDIPVRVDELYRTLPQATDYTQAEAELKHYKAQLAVIEESLVDSTNRSKKLFQKQSELINLQGDLRLLKAEVTRQSQKSKQEAIETRDSLRTKLSAIEADVKYSKKLIEARKADLVKNTEELGKLREEWKNVDLKKVVSIDSDKFVCPTCKQDLPQGQKEEKLAELRANFDKSIIDEKTAINTQGKALKAENENLENKIKELEETISISARIEIATKSKIIELQKIIDQETPVVDFNVPEVVEIEDNIKVLEAELQAPAEDVAKNILKDKLDTVAEIERLNKALNNKVVAEHTAKRIEELKTEEKQIAQQKNELERHKFLIEEFVKTKADIMECAINSKFQCVRFKLFDTQINGGVVPCCEALVNTNGAWVTFNDANNAGKINAGLDIINTLTEFYRVQAPIFIDNRESVNKITNTQSQIINLIVSDNKKLVSEAV